MARFKKREMDRKSIARERIAKLFQEAKEAKELSLKDRYVALAVRISQKFRVRIPSLFKRRFCRSCKGYFTCSNSRTRLSGENIVTYCSRCKRYSKFRFKS